MSVQKRPNGPSESTGTILAGGIALVGGALAFLGVFSFLAARFHNPEVLDGRAEDVLPALLATGAVAAVFDGLNSYLGNYVGEFLGECSFSVLWRLPTTIFYPYG